MDDATAVRAAPWWRPRELVEDRLADRGQARNAQPVLHCALLRGSPSKECAWRPIRQEDTAGSSAPRISSFSLSPHERTRTTVFPARRSVELKVATRSEEHTAELQSLMRITYAVLCLKKNTK